jgi:hypothetical protein
MLSTITCAFRTSSLELELHSRAHLKVDSEGRGARGEKLVPG